MVIKTIIELKLSDIQKLTQTGEVRKINKDVDALITRTPIFEDDSAIMPFADYKKKRVRRTNDEIANDVSLKEKKRLK